MARNREPLGTEGNMTPPAIVRAVRIVQLVRHKKVRVWNWSRQYSANAPTRLSVSRYSATTLERASSDRRSWRLSTVFQPIVDLSTGVVTGYEALSRLFGREDEGFQAIAEQVGYNEWNEMLDVALRAALRRGVWRPAGTALFVNVSVKQAWRLTADDVRSACKPGPVVIELPERVDRMVNWERLGNQLGAIGLQLAMDDFGAGNGDFERLMAIHPRWLKLDQGVTMRLADAEWGRRIVRALHRVLRDGGVSVIAEGIENAETLEWLREIGIEYGQGFLLARPALVQGSWRRSVVLPALDAMS